MKKLSRLFQRWFRAIRVGWFLAWRQLRRSGKGTTVLIIFIMTLTFLNLVVVSGLLVGLISGSFQQFRQGYAGEIIITSAPGRNYIENSPALIGFLRSHPSVDALVARHSVGATILGTLSDLPQKNERRNQIGARLTGLNVEDEESVTRFSRFIMEGEMLQPDEWGYMLIGKNMLKKYSAFADANIPGLDLLEGVDVGSRVRATIALQDGGAIQKDFIVKGIVDSKVDEISTRFFVLDQELKQLLPVNQEQVQEIAIKAADADVPGLITDIANFQGNNQARVQTYQEAIPSFLRDIETTMGVLGSALSSFALVVAAITVFIVVFINAVTKRKFIGIMKGIGISPLAVQFSYTVQAMFYGIVGSAIGLLLTFGFLRPYFDANPINFPFSDGILAVTASGAGIRVAILLVVTLFAGYIPATLIVRKNTLDSILGR
jgi:ABC-type lipoprotein release transport system permease subunit